MFDRSTLDSILSDGIKEILEVTKTESCSLLLMKTGEKNKAIYQSYRAQDGQPKAVENDKGTWIYPIASMTKLLIAIALHLIVDIYSKSGKPEHKRYEKLNSWDLRYVERLNDHVEPKVLKGLRGDPTLLQLSIHLNGLPDLNRFLFAPDDTTIMSKEGFIELLNSDPTLTEKETSKRVEYSNANYILIGILIETVSGVSLGEFIKNHILQPLEMKSTYVNLADLDKAPPSSTVDPYLIDQEGKRVKTGRRPLLLNVVEIAALGIYSCTSDLAKLYRALLESSSEDSTTGILNEESIRHLFGYNSRGEQEYVSTDGNEGPSEERWAPYGMVTKASEESLLGFRAANHFVVPDERINFALDRITRGEDRDIYYQAGLVSTFSCSAYTAMRDGYVVVVMSNTLGQGDAADYVARLLLQTCLDFKVRRLKIPSFLRSRRGEVNAGDKIRPACEKFSNRWSEKLQICKMTQKVDDSEKEKLVGIYKNERYVQSLKITSDGTDLSVQFWGKKDMHSGKCRLASIATRRLLICPKAPSIDWFRAWKDMELHYEMTSNMETVSRVTSRIGETGVVIDYIRQS